MSADPSSLSAVERLAISRERLRQSLRDASAGRRTNNRPMLGGAPGWLDGLLTLPGARVVFDALRSWWSQHPMRLATLVATDAAKTLVRPLAQRNPLGLVLGALVVGGVLAWVKPWRGIIKPALFAGLLPQIISRAMAQVPVESWMSVLMTLAQQSTREPSVPSAESQPVDPEEPKAPTEAHQSVH
ncbi:MAG: hypothetical protein ABI605_20675 [Rhizobacter sp.]